MIYRTLHSTFKIRQREPLQNEGWMHMIRKSELFLFHPTCYLLIFRNGVFNLTTE